MLVGKWKFSRRDYVLRDGSKFLLYENSISNIRQSEMCEREFVNSSRTSVELEIKKKGAKRKTEKSIYATSTTCGELSHHPDGLQIQNRRGNGEKKKN